MSRRVLIAGDSSRSHESVWIPDVFARRGWQAETVNGEFATNRRLDRADREDAPFDALVVADVWMQLCTISELSLPAVQRIRDRNTRRTGLRVFAYARQCGMPAAAILCLVILPEEDVLRRLQQLDVRTAMAEEGRAALHRLMDAIG